MSDHNRIAEPKICFPSKKGVGEQTLGYVSIKCK